MNKYTDTGTANKIQEKNTNMLVRNLDFEKNTTFKVKNTELFFRPLYIQDRRLY